MFPKKEKEPSNFQRYKIILAVSLLIIGCILLFIGGESDTAKQVKKEAEKEKPATDIDNGTPYLDNFAPDANQEPFVDNPSSVTVSSYSFYRPVERSNWVEPNTNSILTAVGDKMMLFRSYGETSYIYNNEEGIRQVVDIGVSKAVMCVDTDYLMYISTYDFRHHKIIPFEIGFGSTPAIYTGAYDEQITAIACGKEHLYFTIVPTQGSPVTRVMPLPHYHGKLRPSESHAIIKNTSSFFAQNDEDVYVYLPKEKKLQPMTPKTTANAIPINTPDTVEEMRQIELNQKGDYVALYINEQQDLVASVNENPINDFTGLIKVAWYDDTHLLLLDMTTLYFYDTQTNQKEVLKTNVSDFIIDQDDVYYHDIIGTLFYLERKTEE